MTLRVGLIGCGAISESHLTALCAQTDVNVVACADLCLEAAQRRADQFEIPHVFSNADELLELVDIDLVSICVPPKWHEKLFLDAIACNKHVLIEKPLATDLAGADRMVEAMDKSDRIAAVPLIHRYSPGYHALRQLIECGAIGSVRSVRLEFGTDMYRDSRFSKHQQDPRGWLVNQEIAGGGLLMSSTIHFLSVLLHVLGNFSAKSVTAHVQQLHPKSLDGIEDDVDLSIKLDNGSEILLHESWRRNIPYRCEIIGDCGRFLITSGNTWNDLSIIGRCQGDVPRQYQSFLKGDEFHAEASALTAPFSPSFGGLMEDLFCSIQKGKHMERLPDLLHARNMQAIVAACYQSERLKTVARVDWRKNANLLPSISKE
ncbi:MAG: Gfo/Idh/MocA family oxidoreductase [Planctomycetes bacterium]|nr:Gfo/Idh/MocA family oxidoreductase [Planctomycetota bacterium]